MQSNTIKHLILAAESGDAAAQFNLGVLCDSRLDDNGYTIEGDRAEAMKWLLAAAEQGLARAQSRLAEMYAEGPDAPGDYINACAWFILAMTNLRGIHRHRARSGYDRVSSYLTTAQLAKARRLAVSWKTDRQKKAASVPSPENVLVEAVLAGDIAGPDVGQEVMIPDQTPHHPWLVPGAGKL